MVFFAPRRGEGACLRMKLTDRKLDSGQDFQTTKLEPLDLILPEMGTTPILLSSMS